eukprot:3701761-Pleurochrysis_carterae.AAC.7
MPPDDVVVVRVVVAKCQLHWYKLKYLAVVVVVVVRWCCCGYSSCCWAQLWLRFFGLLSAKCYRMEGIPMVKKHRYKVSIGLRKTYQNSVTDMPIWAQPRLVTCGSCRVCYRLNSQSGCTNCAQSLVKCARPCWSDQGSADPKSSRPRTV